MRYVEIPSTRPTTTNQMLKIKNKSLTSDFSTFGFSSFLQQFSVVNVLFSLCLSFQDARQAAETIFVFRKADCLKMTQINCPFADL